MKKQDFYFDLPTALIAQQPLPKRSSSRLLVYRRDIKPNNIAHHQFIDLPQLLQEGDLLVLNNSRVMQARLFGYKPTGGKVELLVERVLDNHQCLAQIRSSKSPREGTVILLQSPWQLNVLGRSASHDDLFLCQANGDVQELLASIGHLPLPPYIKRKPSSFDKNRYQTVFAQQLGSVAAPTAGLHFDEETILQLKKKGINLAFTTLHVGAGTFQPVRVDDITNHTMHPEQFTITEDLVEAVVMTKKRGGRVIAVGTTA